MGLKQDILLHIQTATKWLSDEPMATESASVIAGLAGEFDKKAGEIEQNRNLSSQGKAAARLEAVAELEARVDGWRGEVVTPLDKAIEGQQRALAEANAPSAISEIDAVRLEIRNAEIRQSLRDVDPLTLRGMFSDLDPEIQSALRSGPLRPQRTDSGELSFVSLAPPVEELSSPELETALQLRDGLSGLATQLVSLAKGSRFEARAAGRAP